MSTQKHSLSGVHRRAQLPVSVGIALLWLVPMVFVSVITAQGRETPIVHAWSRYWYVLYALSLATWWLLPARWFKPRAGEVRIYRFAGVRTFKTLMVGGDRHNAAIRKIVPGYRSFAGRNARRQLIHETVAAEKAHTIMFLFALWPTILGLVLEWWMYAAITSVGNIIVNVYPIMLQRETRARIWSIDAREKQGRAQHSDRVRSR